MGGTPPHAVWRGVSIYFLFFVAMGRVLLAICFYLLLRNRHFRASGEPFFIFFASEHVFGGKNIIVCFKNHVF